MIVAYCVWCLPIEKGNGEKFVIVVSRDGICSQCGEKRIVYAWDNEE